MSSTREDTTKDRVDRLQRTLSQWRTHDVGAHAAIRRARPGDTGSPVLWRLLLSCGIDPPDHEAARWALIAWALASLDGASRTHLGSALQRAELSPLRLERLLRADISQLPDCLRSAVRQLVAKGVGTDGYHVAALVLRDVDTESGERIRRQIARNYYGRGRSESEVSNNSEVNP